MNALRLVAATDASVLLLGEPGTGRAALAHEIHAASPRAGQPILSFVCTGASGEGFARLLDQSSGAKGSLFLQGIADLGLEDQARLWRLLTEQDRASAASGWRIIASSAPSLDQEVRLGRFRADLYQRLSVVPLDVPPLRERTLDVPILTAHFIRLASLRHRLEPPRLRSGAERLLRRYAWPGNLRELANLCERLVILLPGAEIGPENLPNQIVRGDLPGEDRSGFELPPQGIDLNELEADLIRQALSLTGGNKSRAARLLGLTRDTLLYRLQKHLIPG